MDRIRVVVEVGGTFEPLAADEHCELHLSKLARMSWVKSMESNYRIQNALGNYDSLSKRATVIRVNDELDKVLGK